MQSFTICMISKMYILVVEVDQFMRLFHQFLSLFGFFVNRSPCPYLKGMEHIYSQIVFFTRISDTSFILWIDPKNIIWNQICTILWCSLKHHGAHSSLIRLPFYLHLNIRYEIRTYNCPEVIRYKIDDRQIVNILA